uniref:Uncharacterized protein n=1 Tax=Rhizophora mucronata TaxID=61149 RepID=A0A2P2NCD0_RHIMU
MMEATYQQPRDIARDMCGFYRVHVILNDSSLDFI